MLLNEYLTQKYIDKSVANKQNIALLQEEIVELQNIVVAM